MPLPGCHIEIRDVGFAIRRIPEETVGETLALYETLNTAPASPEPRRSHHRDMRYRPAGICHPGHRIRPKTRFRT